MIYLIDVVSYNGEPVLEARLEYLSERVDELVIVESKCTHSGTPKPCYFGEKFSDILQKFPNITYLQIDSFPPLIPDVWMKKHAADAYMRGGLGAWFRENYQRDFALPYIQKKYAGKQYIVMCSDVDEIPSLDVVNTLKANYASLSTPIYFHQRFYMYNLNWETDEFWSKAFVINDTGLTPEHSLSDIRTAPPKRVFPSAGWHLSFCLAKHDLIRKIQSFAHTEFNKDKFTSEAHVEKCLANGSDIFSRQHVRITRTATTDDLPEPIKKFHEKIMFAQRY
ncbi:glycosyl transferase [Tribonema minus]|uniref:Glycosyl transferase n=1 Tax=Tribonema minus TaxID=303371 RepID=A0A835Z442_9STRA|nr:glycosyl transferase [Tribonema minus]